MKANMLLEVQTRTLGDELAGEPPETWATIRSEWADVRPLSGREYYQAQQIEATTTHKITTRYFAGADRTMKLIRPNVEDPETPLRTFNVESVVNVDERNRFLEWMCQEVV